MNETSGSPVRDARSVDGPFLTLDLEDVLGQLDDETTARDEPRTSMTVLHRPALRVVVSRLRDGARIGDERSDEDVVIVALDGTADLDVDGTAASLRRGTLASVASGRDWSLSGRDEAVAVLVFGSASNGGVPGPVWDADGGRAAADRPAASQGASGDRASARASDRTATGGQGEVP